MKRGGICRFLRRNLKRKSECLTSILSVDRFFSLVSQKNKDFTEKTCWKRYLLQCAHRSAFPFFSLNFPAKKKWQHWNEINLTPLFLQRQRASPHFQCSSHYCSNPYTCNCLSLHFVHFVFACPLLHPFHLCDGEVKTSSPPLPPSSSPPLPSPSSSSAPLFIPPLFHLSVIWPCL